MRTGIDYGNGQTNIDKETGIRYGVISPDSLCPEALDDIKDPGIPLFELVFRHASLFCG